MFSVLIPVFVLMLSGCVVRTYEVTKDRVDQDMSMGNRGYLMGQPPAGAGLKEKRMTRQTHVVEVEVGSPVKFEKRKKMPPQAKEMPVSEEMDEGNRGYIGGGPVVKEPAPAGNFEKYTVEKGDTLQKISQKFYGTTKKWMKIYDANSAVLKGPNKIYPGQTLNIPVEAMKEPRENLK